MKKNPAIMRYKNDTAAAGFCYLAIIFDIVYFIALYSNSSVVPNIEIGTDVIINILFMLVVFWASEMVKVYNQKWAVGLAVLGVIQILRVFWIPPMYNGLGQLVGGSYAVVCLSLVLSAAALFAGTVTGWRNSAILQRYLNETAVKGNSDVQH